MEYQFNKGSEWRKWDLHIHTKFTNKNDQFKSPSFGEFCNIMFRKALEKDISVIGITDYFSIENYLKVVEFQKNIETSLLFDAEEKIKIKNIFILPNIELRMLPSTNAGKLINIHCIFNPSYVHSLENDFFGSIEHTGAGKNCKMNRQGLIDLGKQIDTTADTDKAYQIGINNFAVSPQYLKDLLKNDEFRNNVIVVVSNSTNDGASGLQKHYDLFENDADSSLDAVRKSIYYMSDCIFSSNDNDIQYFAGKKKDTTDIVKEKCGSLKPCIHGSDAHSEEKLFNPDNNRYCWIKADTTFEGLKQIICEPERVKIQLSAPNQDRAKYNIIEKVKFIDNSTEDRFTDFEIGFSDNLNTIIGGKSSGKSLLMHMMAQSLGNNTDNKDYSRLIDKVKLEIYYADSPSKKREQDDRRIVEFLPQLHIENIVRGQKGENSYKAFNDFIENILKQDIEVESTFKKEKKNLDEKKLELATSITKWIQLDESYISLMKELIPLGDVTAIQSAIIKMQEDIASLTKGSGLTDDELKTFNELSSKNQRIQDLIDRIDTDINSILQLKEYVQEKLKSEMNDSIKFQTENARTESLFNELRENIGRAIQETTQNFTTTHIEADLLSLNKRKSLLIRLEEINKETLSPFLEKNKIQDEITKLRDKIKIENEKIKLIREKETEINQEKEKRDKVNLIEIYTEINRVYDRLEKLINDEISKKWDRGDFGLTLQAAVKFNNNDYTAQITSMIDMRNSLENQFGNTNFNGNEFIYNKILHIENIKKLFNNIISDSSRFDNFKKGHKLDGLLNALFSNCFFIDYDIRKGQDSIRDMSEGKKGIVILQLYLSLSNAEYPILIDQPEDNLDNRTVYQELNNYIKTCKLKRQIIMVSHNANLVVNTDAENIIVANQMGEDGKENRKFKFEYINGSLENTFSNESKKGILYQKGIREHVCEILEGGTEAFKKREEKYRIKSN